MLLVGYFSAGAGDVVDREWIASDPARRLAALVGLPAWPPADYFTPEELEVRAQALGMTGLDSVRRMVGRDLLPPRRKVVRPERKQKVDFHLSSTALSALRARTPKRGLAGGVRAALQAYLQHVPAAHTRMDLSRSGRTPRLSVPLPPALVQAAEARAVEENASLSEILRAAVVAWIQ
jgi:hypothetical protein